MKKVNKLNVEYVITGCAGNIFVKYHQHYVRVSPIIRHMTLVSVKVTVRVTGKHTDTKHSCYYRSAHHHMPLINIFSCLLYINGINLYGVEHCRALFYWIDSSLEIRQVETVRLSWNCLTKVLYWWLRSDVTLAWHYVIITSSPSQVGPPGGGTDHMVDTREKETGPGHGTVTQPWHWPRLEVPTPLIWRKICFLLQVCICMGLGRV